MNKKLLVTTLTVVSLLSVNVAFAVSGNGIGQTVRKEVQEKKDEVKTALQAVKHAKAVAKCDIVTSKIEKRVENYDHQKAQHLTSYNRTRDKLQALITKLEGEKYDVNKLKADLTEFDAKLKKFNDDYATYTSLLSETKTDSCAKDETDFRSKLEEARTQLKVVHEDAVAIRTFYAKTFRADLLALKEKKNDTETTEKTETNTNTNEQ